RLSSSCTGEMSVTTIEAPSAADSIVNRPGPAPISSTRVARAHESLQEPSVELERHSRARRLQQPIPFQLSERIEVGTNLIARPIVTSHTERYVERTRSGTGFLRAPRPVPPNAG